jgi:hypothetical protein
MAVNDMPDAMDRINMVLEHLFREHGIEAVRRGSAVWFPAYPGRWMYGDAAESFPCWRLDFALGVEPDRILVETVSAIGRDPIERLEDGFAAFVEGSFHVLLSAFFGAPLDEHVDREDWDIAGQRRAVFIGGIFTRQGPPRTADGEPDLRFFAEFERLLKAQPLPPGTHWMRLYHSRFRGEEMGSEVLLDNKEWDEMQQGMSAFDWPVSDTPYDVKMFFVIRDVADVPALPSPPAPNS